MDIESAEQIYTFAGLRQLCKSQKKLSQGQPKTKLCSFLGIVTDYSNWTSGFQKIFIIDDTDQRQPLQAFIRDDLPQNFVTNARIGDIAYFKYFQVANCEGELLALRAEEIQDSKIQIFPVKSEQTSKMKQIFDSTKGRILKQRIEMLQTFSLNYFSTKKLDLSQKQQTSQQNPQQQGIKGTKPKNKNIILRVIFCEVHKSTYRIRLTDQKQIFTMNFLRRVESGVYLLRAYQKIKKGKTFLQIQTNNNTNLIEISPWMRSYQIQETLSIQEILEKPMIRYAVSTKAQRENVIRTSLQSLRQSDEHLKDVKVKCQIMDITTPFEKVFRRLVKKKRGKITYYEQFGWEHPEGQLILFVHMFISDPTLKGQVFNAYLYSFDGKGNQFIPGLKMQLVQELLVNNQDLLKKQYNQFVNTVLQKTSYQQMPLEMILSPFGNRQNGTVYRIIDTTLSFD